MKLITHSYFLLLLLLLFRVPWIVFLAGETLPPRDIPFVKRELSIYITPLTSQVIFFKPLLVLASRSAWAPQCCSLGGTKEAGDT